MFPHLVYKHILTGWKSYCWSTMWSNGSNDIGLWGSQQTTCHGLPGLC